jgi:hypothetical protein
MVGGRLFRVRCPDCRKSRVVDDAQWGRFHCGRFSGRCRGCYKSQRKAASVARAARLAADMERRAAERAAERAKRAEARGPVPLCRNCRKFNTNRPRGLCWSCYYTPGVRDRYPSTSKYARRGSGNGAGPRPVALAPTTAPPGSPEKVAVMERRADDKRAIFHPADARYEGDPRPLDFLKQLSERGAAA